jgi:hypothetical protein
VADYRPPKDSDKLDEEIQKLHAEGCAPSRGTHGTLPIKQEEGESVEAEVHDSCDSRGLRKRLEESTRR